MKKILHLKFFLAIILLFVSAFLKAQTNNVGIGTLTPDASALLHLDATNKGFLVTRMTAVQRLGITAPANGLLVYDTDSSCFFYYKQSTISWISLCNTSGGIGCSNNNYVIKSAGTSATCGIIYDSGTNIGIGTATPDASSLLDITSATTGVLLPRMTAVQRLSIATPANGLLVFDTDSQCIFFYDQPVISWVSLCNGTGSGPQNAWLITGNGNTVANTNFLGTTNNVTLTFKVNNLRAGLLDNLLGNTLFGYQAFPSGGGIGNTSIGFESQFYGGGQSRNATLGYRSMYNSGNNGGGPLNNVAVGYEALYTCGLGGGGPLGNVGVGYHALYNMGGGGSGPLDNTAVGRECLLTCNGGLRNTGIGAGADLSTAGLMNAGVMGWNAVVNASNKIRLGNTTVTTVETELNYSTISDGRFKYNINQDEVVGLDFILRLRPVVYNFDSRKFQEFLTKNMPDSIQAKYFEGMDFNSFSSIRQSGFIAQEMEGAMKESGYNFSGLIIPKDENDNYGISYGHLTVPLVKAVQELQKQMEELKIKNEKLIKENANYDSRIKALEEILRTKTEK